MIYEVSSVGGNQGRGPTWLNIRGGHGEFSKGKLWFKKTKVSCVTTRRSPENHDHQKDIIPVSLKSAKRTGPLLLLLISNSLDLF